MYVRSNLIGLEKYISVTTSTASNIYIS